MTAISAQERVLSVLGRHLSVINAQNVLARALRETRVTTAADAETVRRLHPALERGLRLFLPVSAVADVLVELSRAFAPAEPPGPQLIPIRVEADVSEARLAARALCEVLGARRVVIQKVATVVSELARNIFMYAGGGLIELVPGARPRPTLLIRATDEGPGIPHLDDVLGGRYRSRTGLGAGLVGTRRLVDRFEISTGPGGTRIEAGVDL
jgi:serine/threonine-protein kinase RsbT